MKSSRFIATTLLTALVLVVFGMGRTGWGANRAYPLTVRQSPLEAGIISPAEGIHMIGAGDVVTLQATAKPGYRFLYWMGDVTDLSASETLLVANAPKTVIAVFERTEDDMLLSSAGNGQSGPGGGGGQLEAPSQSGYYGVLTPSRQQGRQSGGIGSVGSTQPVRSSRPSGKSLAIGSITLPDGTTQGGGTTGGGTTPSGGSGSEGPTGEGPSIPDGPEIPEPATLLLLSAGGILLFGRRRNSGTIVS